MKMKSFKSLIVVMTLLVSTIAGAQVLRSLSGDNWKDPLRTKTWTPPNISDNLVGEQATQELKNKTINGVNNSFLNIPAANVNLTGLVDTDADVLATDTVLQAAGKINSKQGKVISGESQLSEKLKTLKAPHSTMTNLGNGLYNLEHGSGQRLYNGSFEFGAQGWNCSPGVIESTVHNDQGKSLNLVGLDGRDMECYQDFATANYGTVKHEANAWFRSMLVGKPTKGEICARQNGVNVNCVTFDASKDQWNLQQTFADAGSTTTGIYFKIYGDGVNTYNVLVDKTLAGVYTATNSFMNVTQETQPQACTFASLAWAGLGTVTHDLICKRIGGSLSITGSFTVASATAVTAVMPMPNNYGSINYPAHSNVRKMGDYYRKFSDSNKGGLILSKASPTNEFNFSTPATYGAGVNDALIPVLGTNIGNYLYVIDMLVPIAEWQQNLNVAVSKCLEGPLKCSNLYSIYADNVGGRTLNIEGWATVTVSVNSFTVNYSAVGFTAIPNCVAVPSGTAAFTVRADSRSLTQTVFTTHTNAGGAYTPITVVCTKTFPDYNVHFDNISVAPLMDIRSTEFLTGAFDYIRARSIYRRCYVTSTAITAPTTLATWPSNLNPVNIVGWLPNLYAIKNTYVSTGAGILIQYNKSNGQLLFEKSGAGQISAFDEICMDYTKN